MAHYKTEIRSTFDKDYLKVFLKDKSQFENVKSVLEQLQSIKRVNVTENNETDLTVYPSKLYSAKETEQEITITLDGFFEESPLDPVFEKEAISHISDKSYAQIIDRIFSYGANLEKYKDLYDKFDEEGFRSFFLPHLNSISTRHRATGETFNKIGKTDILIQDENGKNVFIAECKLWKGAGEITAAIDQLLERYVTWRDEKVALIIFNKDAKNFGDIIPKAVEAVKTHKLCKSYDGQRHSTCFSFSFTNPEDTGKIIKLELILFNCN